MKPIQNTVKLVLPMVFVFMVFLNFLGDKQTVYVPVQSFLKSIKSTGGELDIYLPGNKTKLQFAISVCQEKLVDGQGFKEDDRQFRQIKVLLKSAALLTRTTITYNIITDSHEVYKQIVNSTLDWPLKYRQRLIFAYRKDVYNPPEMGMGDVRNLYRPCASQRLFLAFSFPDEDAMVYTDTDAFFMQPPENLWQHFSNFDHKQVAGVTAHLFQYTPPFNAFPVFGWTGLNSGVVLMNLTRIREFPNGWINAIKDIKQKFNYAMLDQDILNNLFSGDNEVYAYEVPCEWNYMFIMCNFRRNTCPGFVNNGLALLHGVDWSFVNEKGPKFKAIFFEWEKYDMKSSVEELVAKMENATKLAPKHACGKVSNIDKFIMKGIKDTLLSTSKDNYGMLRN